MSVHKTSASRWQVRWRENGRNRQRTFDRKGDADKFDRERRRRSQLGPTLAGELDRRTITLDGFIRTGFRAHAVTLAPKTREQYGWVLKHHLVELLDEPLATLGVPRLAEHQAWLIDNGRTPNTVREALTRLSGILQVAVEHGHMRANPVRGMRKLPLDPRPEVQPLAPVELERLIGRFNGADRIICVLCGHLGLRPMEARLVRWENYDDRVLTVSRARTKRAAARTRVITVPALTAHDLKQWRLESGRPGPDEPIIGREMSKTGFNQWAWKKLGPAAKALLGRSDVTPYTLRHSHASALHYCGWTVPAAARRLGHSGQVHVGHYAHVIDAIEKVRYTDLDALLADARMRAENQSDVRPWFAQD